MSLLLPSCRQTFFQQTHSLSLSFSNTVHKYTTLWMAEATSTSRRSRMEIRRVSLPRDAQTSHSSAPPTPGASAPPGSAAPPSSAPGSSPASPARRPAAAPAPPAGHPLLRPVVDEEGFEGQVVGKDVVTDVVAADAQLHWVIGFISRLDVPSYVKISNCISIWIGISQTCSLFK